MNSSSSWATQEPHAELWFEQTNNAAVYIGAVAYGIHIVIFGMCVEALMHERKKRNFLWLLYITVLFALGTANICLNINFNELTWIDDRNYPGGPLAFLLEQQARPANTAGNAAAIIITFLADGLLLWRCYRVWQKWYIMVIPTLMWLAATVLSALTTIQAALPASSLWANNTFAVSVPYWSLSIALTLVLTLLLIARLLYIRRKIVSVLGLHYGRTYSSVVAMVLESALLYGLVSLVFIILYGLHNTAENLFIPLLAQVECISPMLIILRVCRGRAVDNDFLSEEKLTQIKFRANPSTEDTNIDSTMTFKAGSTPNLVVGSPRAIAVDMVDCV
ncbi:hypothetical protein GY45DRAFT_1322808 [Cubamyces sp. BRFM 1775]|nr:hypothetical protein GY45DRAFT_1322808 [Cubamyces sp. BRFM 1775]